MSNYGIIIIICLVLFCSWEMLINVCFWLDFFRFRSFYESMTRTKVLRTIVVETMLNNVNHNQVMKKVKSLDSFLKQKKSMSSLSQGKHYSHVKVIRLLFFLSFNFSEKILNTIELRCMFLTRAQHPNKWKKLLYDWFLYYFKEKSSMSYKYYAL